MSVWMSLQKRQWEFYNRQRGKIMQEKENGKLEQLLNTMGAKREKKDMDAMMALIKEAFLYVPVMFPDNMTKEQIEQLAKNNGRQGGASELFKESAPQPCLLEDTGKNKYLPIFTSKKQIPAEAEYPMLLFVPFQICVNILIRLLDVKGIAVNPFTNNIILNLGKVEKREDGRQKLSPEQIPALIRMQVEGADIPLCLHQKKAEFMQALDEKREAFILEFYQAAYAKNKLKCPYREEDFEVMYLGISDELEIARITLPAKNLAPGMSKLLFFTQNITTKEVHFYAIVKGIPAENDFIGEILADGKKVTVQDAPKEGNELNAILGILDQ